MPSWKIHFSVGVVFFIFWMKLFYSFIINDIFYIIFTFLLAVFSSIFADIDTTKSKIRDFVSISVATSFFIFFIFFYPYIEIPKILIISFITYLVFKYFPTKHRGYTHTFVFSIMFSLFFSSLSFLFYPDMIFFTFIILLTNYNLHIILDLIEKF